MVEQADARSIDRATTARGEPARVRERAIAAVVSSLGPLPFLLLPFTLIVSSVLGSDLPVGRRGWWSLWAVVVTLVTLLALSGYRRRDVDRPVSRWVASAVGVSFVGSGTVMGLATWVAAPAGEQVTSMFTLFPATAAAVAALVTATRRDYFVLFVVSLWVSTSAGLLSADSGRLRGLALVGGFYLIALVVLHKVVHRTVMEAIDLQVRSEHLVAQLEHERVALSEANLQLEDSNVRLAQQARNDHLTGLSNRRGTVADLDRLLADATPTQPVGLLFIDLDRFKAVNDALGHRGGDRFLTIIADRLARSIEAGGVVGRMGGDEFVVVLPGLDAEHTLAVAHRIIGVLSQPVHAEGRDMPSSVSVGVASAPAHGSTTSELLRHANGALHRAKALGRNRVEMFDLSMQLRLTNKIEAEQALRRAIDSGEIVPYFQPEIDAVTGRLVGAELLARWVQRDGSVVPASRFIRTAMEAGLLDRVTERVFAAARPHVRRLAMLGLPEGFRFRINATPSTMTRTWRDRPIDLLMEGLDPTLLTVDVAEIAVTGDLPSAAANLASFRSLGGRVCLDDFARGVSSLSLLRRVPLDEVRIDRSSIDTITAHPHDRAIVRSIISLVREIGLSVTADGVETGAQADTLIALGCVRHQGHLYAPALPASEFESFLLDRMAKHLNAGDAPVAAWQTDELTGSI